MFKRLTVQQIGKIKPPLRIKQISLKSAFFTKSNIFVIQKDQPQFLKKIDYDNFEIQSKIQLPQLVQNGQIKSLIQVEKLIVFVVQGSNDLFYINTEGEICQLSSHLQNINQVIYFALQKQIITCSDDFTVRVWQNRNGKILPSKKKHILPGHQDKVSIICSLNFHNLLVSASKDNTVIFWKDGCVKFEKKFSSPVSSLLYCQKSNQCLVFCDNFEIFGIKLNQILKNPNQVQISKILNKTPQQVGNFQQLNSFQVDDSFVAFLENGQFVFLEKNIGQIIKRIQLCKNKYKIFDMIIAGRLAMFTNQKGIHLLKF